MKEPKKGVHPIDKHIGKRIRARRMEIGLSQEKVGYSLNLTFQQLQKYENGTNRVSCSKLAIIAKVLGVEPGYFFEGAPAVVLNGTKPATTANGHLPATETAELDVLATREGAALVRVFASISDPNKRRAVIDVAARLAA